MRISLSRASSTFSSLSQAAGHKLSLLYKNVPSTREAHILLKSVQIYWTLPYLFYFHCTTAMNVQRGYEGPRNDAFLSLRSRQVPRTTDNPPPPFVTMAPEQGLLNSPSMRPLIGPPITQFGFTRSSSEPYLTGPLFGAFDRHSAYSAPETSQSWPTVTTGSLHPADILPVQTIPLRAGQTQTSSNIPAYSLSSRTTTTPVRTSPVATVYPATTIFPNRSPLERIPPGITRWCYQKGWTNSD